MASSTVPIIIIIMAMMISWEQNGVALLISNRLCKVILALVSYLLALSDPGRSSDIVEFFDAELLSVIFT